MKWLAGGHITSDNGSNLFELRPNHKRAIVKRVHKSNHVSDQVKADILESTLGDDVSDIAQSVRNFCRATTSDLAVKEQIWNDILDPNSSLSLYEKNALMGGFYSWDQVDALDGFYDKFYDSLETIYTNQTWKFVSSYTATMLPRMKIEDRHIVKLITIKSQVADNNGNYMKVLQDGIELLIRSKKIRDMAKK